MPSRSDARKAACVGSTTSAGVGKGFGHMRLHGVAGLRASDPDWVALTDDRLSRDGLVNRCDFGGGESKLQRADILLQSRQAPRAGNGNDVRASGQDPRQRELGRAATLRLRQRRQPVDGGQVVLQGTGLEARQDRAEVRAFEVGGAAIGTSPPSDRRSPAGGRPCLHRSGRAPRWPRTSDGRSVAVFGRDRPRWSRRVAPPVFGSEHAALLHPGWSTVCNDRIAIRLQPQSATSSRSKE